MLISSLIMDNIKEFTLPVHLQHLIYDELLAKFVTTTKLIGNANIGIMASVYMLICSVAHLFTLIFHQSYIKMIETGKNKFR